MRRGRTRKVGHDGISWFRQSLVQEMSATEHPAEKAFEIREVINSDWWIPIGNCL